MTMASLDHQVLIFPYVGNRRPFGFNFGSEKAENFTKDATAVWLYTLGHNTHQALAS